MQGQRSPLRRRWRTRQARAKPVSSDAQRAGTGGSYEHVRAPASSRLEFDCADFVRLPTRVRGQRLGGDAEESPAQVTISLPVVPTWWEAWRLVDTVDALTCRVQPMEVLL